MNVMHCIYYLFLPWRLNCCRHRLTYLSKQYKLFKMQDPPRELLLLSYLSSLMHYTQILFNNPAPNSSKQCSSIYTHSSVSYSVSHKYLYQNNSLFTTVLAKISHSQESPSQSDTPRLSYLSLSLSYLSLTRTSLSLSHTTTHTHPPPSPRYNDLLIILLPISTRHTQNQQNTL